MSAPQGLGWWVAFEASIDDGPKKLDLAKAIEVCKSTGAKWIAVRAGAGTSPDEDLNAESIVAYQTAGIEPIIWEFDYLKTQTAELGTLARYRKLGVTKVIFNAEFQYIPASAEQARSLVMGARDLGYEWVAHAPPDYAGGRGDGALSTLDAVCDAILPQIYAYEHSDAGHLYHIEAVMRLYAKRGYGADLVWPILCGYRPKVRGYSKNPTTGKLDIPIPTARLANEAERVSADVVAGLGDLVRRGVLAPSIYSIDAMHFACHERAIGDAVLAAVQSWASTQVGTTDHGGTFEVTKDNPATPLGWADRAEVVNETPVTHPETPDAMRLDVDPDSEPPKTS